MIEEAERRSFARDAERRDQVLKRITYLLNELSESIDDRVVGSCLWQFRAEHSKQVSIKSRIEVQQ